ncbi:MAG TPA: sigma-70 family RNA polymerase sigma factor [Vicinamibacterales bacterium]|nr:sigma-70 family RNA polymerase sigma factor [Vicinamibacterales bacterium]
MPDPAAAVTTLLRAWRHGDQAAFERLTPLVYDELRRRARRYLRGERPNHTLRPTALVHEAYLRLVNLDQVDWHDRTHFFALAARQMRRILVDSARARRYQKRGGGAISVTFTEALAVSRSNPDLVALDDALELLTQQDERKGRVVEMRFFGGLTNEEIATVLGISTDTVTRDWQMAKLWLRRELRKETRVSAASEPRERSGAWGPRERACKGVRGANSPGE